MQGIIFLGLLCFYLLDFFHLKSFCYFYQICDHHWFSKEGCVRDIRDYLSLYLSFPSLSISYYFPPLSIYLSISLSLYLSNPFFSQSLTFSLLHTHIDAHTHLIYLAITIIAITIIEMPSEPLPTSFSFLNHSFAVNLSSLPMVASLIPYLSFLRWGFEVRTSLLPLLPSFFTCLSSYFELIFYFFHETVTGIVCEWIQGRNVWVW